MDAKEERCNLTKWSQNPYVIEEDLGEGCFRIRNPTTGHTLRKVVNVCRLKKYIL